VEDLRAQLAALRARIRQLEAAPSRPVEAEPLPGEERQTPLGAHWLTCTSATWHGDFRFSTLAGLPSDALAAISGAAIPDIDPQRMLFLDTETTGLAGGAGTFAFLIGVGRLDGDTFHVRQYLMRDFAEEASALHAVAEELRAADLLVTYNGKAYDEPLLASRYVLSRIRPPFADIPHLDLLHSARRLWRLRFESCRLVELEAQILGHTREGDVPGNLIPQLYFDFLRTRRPGRLHSVLRHNALDILSLAALTAILPGKFANTATAAHAAEMVGLGRWLIAQGQREEAVPLFESAIATMEFDRLAAPRRRDVFVHLAKHYEHRLGDRPRALEMALEALALDNTDAHIKRVERLRHKVSQKKLAP
jgi:uncharacterized protein YprB with RNaseH-like and TPR domain